MVLVIQVELVVGWLMSDDVHV